MEIKGFIIARPDSIQYSAMFAKESNSMLDYGYVVICEHTLTFEVPESFNPVAAQVSALESQREALKEKFYQRVEQINEEISKLQAICYDAPEGK